jgi:hypothetical protein
VPSSPRDKDATWRTLPLLCGERGWSKSRAVYELQNGLPYRTFPPGHVIDWNDPNVTHNLNLETGEIMLVRGALQVEGALAPDTLTVSIEVLPTDTAAVSSAPTRGWWKSPPAETLKTAMEDIASGYPPGVRPTFDEVHKALKQRLGERMPKRAALAVLKKWAPQLVRQPGEYSKIKSPS